MLKFSARSGFPPNKAKHFNEIENAFATAKGIIPQLLVFEGSSLLARHS